MKFINLPENWRKNYIVVAYLMDIEEAVDTINTIRNCVRNGKQFAIVTTKHPDATIEFIELKDESPPS